MRAPTRSAGKLATGAMLASTCRKSRKVDGRHGFVRSKPPRVSPPGDLDADGVPDAFDVDINGNLILNHVDRSTSSRARAAQAASPLFIGANLVVPLWDTVNVNATAVTDAQIDRVLSTYEWLAIGILPGSPELDCGRAPDPNNPQGWIGGLSYCARGGTGEAIVAGGLPSFITFNRNRHERRDRTSALPRATRGRTQRVNYWIGDRRM